MEKRTFFAFRRPAALSLTLAMILAPIGSDAWAQGQQRRPVRATDLYRIRTASDVAISPDGKQIAFVVTQIDSAANAYYSHIWMAEVQRGEPRQLTRGQFRDRDPAWSPDGSLIAFTSSRGASGPQIYVLPLAGGEARQLTKLETGASAPSWAPDGRTILFTSGLGDNELSRPAASAETNPPSGEAAMSGSLAAIRNWLARNASAGEPALITRLDFQGERELEQFERWSQIYTVDIESRRVNQLTNSRHDFQGPAYSPDGRFIAYTATVGDGVHPDYLRKSDLFIMPASGGATRKIEIQDHSVLGAAWSPDGSKIAFAARDTSKRSAANTVVGVIAVAENTANGGVNWLTEPLDRSVRQFRWAADSRAIYFTAGVHGTVPVYRARLADNEIRQLVSGERGVLDFDVTRDKLAYVVTEPANPSELYTSDANGKGEQRFSQLNSRWLTEVGVQPHRGFWYNSHEDRRVQGWVIEPLGYRRGTKYPLVLEIHGGPHVMWGPGEATMWHEFQFLASQGYFVLYTNPRGSDGYGYEFRRAIQRAWGEGPMRDVLTAVDTIMQGGDVDERRMVVTGGSYAGYLTAYLLGHDHRFAAAVAQRGVYDLATFFGEGNAWRLVPYEFDAYPWEDFEILRRNSPITYAHQIETPLLIMHADRDLRTGVSQSEMLYRTLKVLKKPVEYVRYPREGHDLSRSGEPYLRIDRLLRIYEYFERHIRNQDPR